MGLLPAGAELLPPSDDRVFKLLMTSDDESKPVLADLISATIGEPVLDVVVRNNELPSSDTEEKDERFDVNCQMDQSRQADVEMQASSIQETPDGKHENLKGKGVYYLCDLHSSQSARGKKRYDQLSRTYQITFCSYTVFPKKEGFYHSFSLRDDADNEQLTDAIRLIFVELSKLREVLKKPISKMTDLEKWAVFLRYADRPKYRRIVNEIIAAKEEIEVAANLLMSISKDERERAVFRSRRMYRTDYESDLATSWDNGKLEGIREGIREGTREGERNKSIEIARKMLKRGRPADEISEDTGLAVEEIEALSI